MTIPYLEAHPEQLDFDPLNCLTLPTAEGEQTSHAKMVRTSNTGEPLYLLTKQGRAIFAAHLASASPWVRYPASLVNFFEVYGRTNPPTSVNNWTFHFLNLLARYPSFAFRRSDLEIMKIAMSQAFASTAHPAMFPRYDEDGDSIQHVNKWSQFGLQHQTAKFAKPTESDDVYRTVSYYWLKKPYVYYEGLRQTRSPGSSVQPVLNSCDDCSPPLENQETATPALAKKRNEVIDHLYQTWLNVPLSDWTAEGHRDPDNKDRYPLIAQPRKFNRHSKSKWKFDEFGMRICPSVRHLSERMDEFYPSETEQRFLLDYLTERWSGPT